MDGKELFNKLVPPASSTDIDLSVPITNGSRVDFVVTPGTTLDANYDATEFHAIIAMQ